METCDDLGRGGFEFIASSAITTGARRPLTSALPTTALKEQNKDCTKGNVTRTVDVGNWVGGTEHPYEVAPD